MVDVLVDGYLEFLFGTTENSDIMPSPFPDIRRQFMTMGVDCLSSAKESVRMQAVSS